MSSSPSAPQKLTSVQWLICTIAAIGFAFDIYELLMMPLIARPALAFLLHVDPDTTVGNNLILQWTGRIMWGSALCGGTFGLLGGYLTDLLGRRRVLVWSILLYAFSAAAAGFSTSAWMLLILRCTTFIGVCVEFVAAVAWLSELFPDPRQREAVLGYTQAFSSLGGLMITGAFKFFVAYSSSLPAWGPFEGPTAFWRYTLVSGLIPAIPLIVIRPFLPESPAWREKRAGGKLKRPSIAELFQPAFLRTTVVTAALFACGYGAAFGAIQLTPQIVPGLLAGPVLKDAEKSLEAARSGSLPTEAYEKKVEELRGVSQLMKLRAELDKAEPGSEEYKAVKKRIEPLQRAQQQIVGDVQLWQEVGGLVGRFVLAWLALRIVSRRSLLRVFQLPGLIVIPLVYAFPAAGNLASHNLDVLKWGMFAAGFFTVAQFSFWGNYLPRAYPTYLRGTGEGFAANVGGRMIGTAANPLATHLAPILAASMSGISKSASIAYAAAAVAALVYGLGSIITFWLPEPKHEELPD
ncbi:MAG TPA: MFS transporter [Pirellulales bacterium]|nr:MFS transporter [Pirellulales bacterium]